MAASATKKKTRTKKSPAKKQPAKRKSGNTGFEYTTNIIGVVLGLVTLFALGKLGAMGKFFANLLRYLVGSSFQLPLVLILVPIIGMVANGEWPRNFKPRYYVGFAVAYLGIMLGMSIVLFSGMDVHANFIATNNSLIAQDMANTAVSTPVGGGLIGAALYSVTYVAVSNFGSWLLAVVLVVAGVVIAFNLDVRNVFKMFFDLTTATGKVVETGVQNGFEKGVSFAETTRDKAIAFHETRTTRGIDELMAEGDALAGKNKTTQQPGSVSATVAVAPERHEAPVPEASATGFKLPTIVAPEPVIEPSVAIAPVTDTIPVPTDADMTVTYGQPLAPLPDLTAGLTDDLDMHDAAFAVPSGNSASGLTPSTESEDDDEDIYGAPEVDGPTVAPAPLTHAAILGHDNAATSPKTTAHQPTVGHVEPSTQSEPVDDVAVNAMPVIDDANYVLPTTQLLTKVGSTDQSKERNGLAEKARILHETLKSFNINATVEKVVLGPTVTQYEIKPAVGVKVSKITNLADDLALALAAKSLRIEAPIPGKSLVGIEVANEQQAMVGFRDMMDTVGINRQNPMEVPIGKDITGDVVKMDLRKMPHLLIAGSTGSGKSVAINSILASILLQAKPSEVRLMLVDPKKVELSVYNDIPHLITPVVSEPRKAALALKKVVAEMDRRFKLLSEYGVRNIEGYNKLVEKENASGNGTVLQKMPYLVAIIDELADLMITVAGEVEPAIVRIAQLGRAAGIHMIVATQRPSVDVITGLIKANVPSRMAFAVSSGVDSRTILDANGAEKLLGRGDMLFAPIGANSPKRVQGAFLSDEDVEALTDFIRQQGEAHYDESMTVSDDDVAAMDAGDGNGGSDGKDADALDELWDEAVAFVVDQQKASTSLLQRRYRIGYNRAARLMDDLEKNGIIGPADGAKPRRVLISKELYERQLAGE
jgi:S-DNA-T family DNA segregation ATPase FtsK/SpoIIIE